VSAAISSALTPESLRQADVTETPVPKLTRYTLALLATLAVFPAAGLAQDTPADRAAAAQRVYEASLTDLRTGRATEEDVARWSQRWMMATIELGAPGPATLGHLERMLALRELVRSLIAAGALPTRAELACDYYVAEARAFRARPPPR
jgi:hypothetical protein